MTTKMVVFSHISVSPAIIGDLSGSGFSLSDAQAASSLSSQLTLTTGFQWGIVVGFLSGIALSSLLITFLWRRARTHRNAARAARNLADTERRALETHYEHLIRLANDPIILFDADLRIIDANDKALAAYGWTAEEFRRLTAKDLRPRAERRSLEANIQMANDVGGARYETVHQTANGNLFPVEVGMRSLSMEGKRFYQAIIRDISERKKFEASILRLNNLYNLLAKANRRVLDAPNEEKLINGVCQLLVQEGGFSLAYVVLLVADPDGVVAKVSALAGHDNEASASLIFDMKPGPTANVATIRAIREERLEISPLASDSERAVIKQFAGGHNIPSMSMAACPLRRGGKVIGALTVTAPESGFFRAEEILFLGTLSQDLSVALDWMDARLTHQAEEERVRRLSFALEQSPVSVVITDANGDIQYVNRKFTSVTGYSYEEAIGQNPRILKSGEMSAEGYRDLWRTITSGREWRGELQNRRKNGQLYWEFASIAPIRDAKGKISQFVAVKEDITALKASRATARVAADQFRSLFEDAPVAYHEIDTEGILQRVNRAECELLGFEASEMIGQPAWKFTSPESHRASREAIRDKICGNQPLSVFTRKYVRNDGKVLTLEIHESLIRGEGGIVTGIRSTLLDITEHAKTERNLTKAMEQGIAASRATSQFLDTTINELRTPVHGIVGITELLLGSDSSATFREDVNMLRNYACNLLKIVEGIQNFTDTSGGRDIQDK